MHSAYKAELDRLVREGIITEVHEHTEWINSIVPVMQEDGSLRLCLDPKDLNKAIKRNQWYARTLDDILPELAQSKYFTVKDATSGFWHILLDFRSSLMPTFNTLWGKYRWLRMLFGLKVSENVFQERLDRVLRLVPGVLGIVDDIVTHGAMENTHDGTVLILCETARLNNLSLNSKKMQFKSTDCKFFGHKLTPDGIKMDPKKIEAIIHMDPPQNVESHQSFNGMVNYLKKFSPVLSELSEPLRRLCKSGVKWAWESEQHYAFEVIKQVIMALPVLAYFDKTKKHTIQCDAFKKGLGVLLQESKPVMYVSRVLTETEQRYSNIERELLAIVFVLERLNHYTFGRSITVQSNHQPLQSIWKKSIVSASPRLQRLLLRLAHYDINIEFLWGKDSNIDVIPVHNITQSASVSKARLQELRLVTQSDPTLHSLTKTVHEGWPQSKKDCPKQLLDFWSLRQEISEEDGLLYKNQRLKVPHSERLETLKLLHLGHYALDKMHLRALETVYWPGINKDILKQYQSCKTCIKYYKSQRFEPMQSHPTSELPWHMVATDLFEIKKHKYLLLVDYYRVPILHKLGSTTSKVLVQEMKAVFAELGVPNVIVSDGGPQYTSAEFKDFMKQWQIEHRVSSSRNP